MSSGEKNEDGYESVQSRKHEDMHVAQHIATHIPTEQPGIRITRSSGEFALSDFAHHGAPQPQRHVLESHTAVMYETRRDSGECCCDCCCDCCSCCNYSRDDCTLLAFAEDGAVLALYAFGAFLVAEGFYELYVSARAFGLALIAGGAAVFPLAAVLHVLLKATTSARSFWCCSWCCGCRGAPYLMAALRVADRRDRR